MIYTKEIEEKCIVNKGANHGPAPIPEEGKWVKAKDITDISGLTHGVGWCAPQQGACKLTLNVKDGVIQEALIECIGDVYKRQGLEGWENHAIETGKMITEMNASYASLLTLMLDPAAPIMKDIESGEMTLLTPEQVVGETYLLLENAMPKKSCVFRSNHASNYISLRGNLPEDRQRMLAQLKVAMENTGLLKDERFRML